MFYTEEKRVHLCNAISEHIKGNFNNDEEMLRELNKYRNVFYYKPDYNYAQYGNLIVSSTKVRDFYNGVCIDTDDISDDELWQDYKRQVGNVIICLILYS